MENSTYIALAAFVCAILFLNIPEQEVQASSTIREVVKYVEVDKSYTEEEKLLARLLESECYLSDVTDLYWVASVVVNRVNDSRFPNTLHGVIYQKGQFDGVKTKHFNRELNKITLAASRHILENGSMINAKIVGYFNPKTATATAYVKNMMPNVVLKGKHHWFHTM